MFKYDPNNLNLINDLKKQCDEESKKNYLESVKKNFEKYFPMENFDNIEEFKLNRLPKNGSTYYKDKVNNKFYEKNIFYDDWKDVTNKYDWATITRTGSFFNYF